MEWSVKQDENVATLTLEARVASLEDRLCELHAWIAEVGDDMIHRTAGVIPITDYRKKEATR